MSVALPSGAAPATRRLGPVAVRVAARAEAVAAIADAVAGNRQMCVAFANTHLLYCAVRDPDFAALLGRFYVVNDGVGMALLARLTCGAGFRENLNGTDFTPLLLARLPPGTRVYLVGARPAVVAAAADCIAGRWPHIVVCGRRDGFAGSAAAQAEVAALQPDLVLAAMGNPVQERWIARAAPLAPHTTFIGVGALFDFLAGATPRAPPLLRAMRLEWAFRLAHEPRRLWRRYTVEILVILAALARSSATGNT